MSKELLPIYLLRGDSLEDRRENLDPPITLSQQSAPQSWEAPVELRAFQ
jgi:hypothetical protein